LDEITLTTTTTVLTIGNGEIKSWKIDPGDFGISYAPISELTGGDGAENALTTLAILRGERGAPRDAIVLNAAAAIAAFRGAQDRTVEDRIAEGVVAAVAAIDTGAATDLLTRWVALTQKLAIT